MTESSKKTVLLCILLALSLLLSCILGGTLLLQDRQQEDQNILLSKAQEKIDQNIAAAQQYQETIDSLTEQVGTLTGEIKTLTKENGELKAAVKENEAASQATEGALSPSDQESIFSEQSNGFVVAIDAGHQGNGGDSTPEPIGPGATETKARDSGGTQGVSGYPEYALNLTMAQKLKEELLQRGYTVYMTRETNDIAISNIERAAIANDNQADVFLRIHANSSEDTSVYGALSMATSQDNPYVDSSVSQQSQIFSQTLIDAFCESTGAYNRGVMITDSMSGLNWSQVPCSILEMGFMSNAAEDAQMQTEEYQALMVQGMANGIDRYLGRTS